MKMKPLRRNMLSAAFQVGYSAKTRSVYSCTRARFHSAWTHGRCVQMAMTGSEHVSLSGTFGLFVIALSGY